MDKLASNDPLTTGAWATEEASASAFDDRIKAIGLFRVYREVEGTLVHPRPGQREKSVRIDRLLVPTETLLNLGWRHRTIGVEIKKSGHPIKDVLTQAADYVRCVFNLSEQADVMPSCVFMWPMDKQAGTTASLMVHLRVGSVSFGRHDRLKFSLGEEVLLSDDDYAGVRVRPAGSVPRSGSRVGSK